MTKQASAAIFVHPLTESSRVGVIMWTLITGYKPEKPFAPRPYSTQVINHPVSGWTYGHSLLEPTKPWDPNNEVDQNLLSVIAQCMDYMPRRRPKLITLEVICEGFMERDWPDANKEIVRAWAGGLFADAPPPMEI